MLLVFCTDVFNSSRILFGSSPSHKWWYLVVQILQPIHWMLSSSSCLIVHYRRTVQTKFKNRFLHSCICLCSSGSSVTDDSSFDDNSTVGIMSYSCFSVADDPLFDDDSSSGDSSRIFSWCSSVAADSSFVDNSSGGVMSGWKKVLIVCLNFLDDL